jgi:hypothetical protein
MNRRDFMLRSAFAAGVAFATGLRAQTPGQAPPNDKSVSLAVGGDTTLGFNLQDHFDAELAAGRPRDELIAYYFAGIRQVLGTADLRVVNLECPFTERGRKLAKNFNFRARLELIDILKAGGVDVVSLANNHLNDWGANGITDTRHTLDAAGIGHFGAGANLAAARVPLLIERNGLKLGFLGYYFQAGDDMLEPRQVYATQTAAGVAGVYKTLAPMKKMLRADMTALAKRVDLPVVYFHWGKEGSYEVQEYQRELAYLAIDCGCRAVLGAHPHRLQGVEVYRNAPIFYSLGNFVYGGIKNPKDALTMIARVRLTRDAFEADVVPLEFSLWPDRPFQPVVLEGDARGAAMARIAELSAGFPTLPALAPQGEAAIKASAS